MIITLKRDVYDEKYTLGTLRIPELIQPIFTVEDCDRMTLDDPVTCKK